MFGVMTYLDVTVCDSIDDAIEKGYIYKPEEYSPIEITKVVVVNKATQGGNTTVDFIMEDKDGKKYVMMLTGNLIKSIPC